MNRFRRRSLRTTLSLSVPEEISCSFPSPVRSPVDLLNPDPTSSRDPALFAGFLGRWTNRSSPATVGSIQEAERVRAERPLLQIPDSIVFDTKTSTQPAPSPRRLRHIPIITPEYASPHGPPQQTDLLIRSASFLDLTLTTELADAPQLDPESSKSCAKEISKLGQGATMNNSQVSLSASESEVDSAASSIHQSHSQTNLASPTHHPNNAAANVSGLVCNVHRTTGQIPHPLVGATTTILGDKLYVFGGRVHSKTQPHLSADLYELDLIRRHWKKLDVIGDVPPPRYFHSVCALGDAKLVCYGGMSPASHVLAQTNGSEGQPEVMVMDDIHIYDVPTNRWTKITPSGADNPQGRYAHCATILPSSAVFASADSHTAAIQNNPSSTNPHSGSIGIHIDGTGGAEMVVLGGQDSNNSYIQQISVFNLRSLRWTKSTPYNKNCGAYKSMVVGLPNVLSQNIGRDVDLDEGIDHQFGTPMLIYSNYNFLDVRLELQVRTPDGNLEEKTMNGTASPPGLRFPNGGIINGHFVVSGTYLTSSKHEYSLWALNLKTLTWAMIDTSGTQFGQGSWNRGILWNRRNSYVILGHRKRNLVEDYNHRRINFTHICLVELEAYGLYDNPRRRNPSSAYISNSAPAVPISLQQDLASKTAGGRQISSTAEELGLSILYVPELGDMEIVAQNGEHVSCNSSILARRWGPFFEQLLLDSVPSNTATGGSESTTLRPGADSRASRISALTITPSTNGVVPGQEDRSQSRSTYRTLVELPNTGAVPASSRGRVLYMPHTAATIRLMLYYLYTSSLPPASDPLCTTHTLCSILQLARPYQIDGLQEATIERLHEVLDGRTSAAVFNAAAMAAGGGRSIGLGGLGTLEALERRESAATTISGADGRRTTLQPNNYGARRGHGRSGSDASTSTDTSATTSTHGSQADGESATTEDHYGGRGRRQVWNGEISSVIGLQKRGLRGLMESRNIRERHHRGE